MKIRILLFFATLICSFPASPSHIAGGEFSLTWMGRGHRYMLSLYLYYDEVHAEGDLKDKGITVSVFEKGTNVFVEEIAMPLTSFENLFDTASQCSAKEPIRVLFYSNEIALLPEKYNHPQGYYISFERCCRNELVNNLENPDEIGATYYLEFPAVGFKESDGQYSVFQNSSPKFKPVNSRYLCLNAFHQIDFGATDGNKDSLVYSLVTPLKGFSAPDHSQNMPKYNTAPYPEADWVRGYSVNNMVPGNPALSMDRSTGILKVTPNREGIYAFSVMVEEYRNGKRIGLVRREFQFTVNQCIPQESLCRVTNSTVTGKNVVIFEKPSDLTLNDSIFIYSDEDTIPFARIGKNDNPSAEDIFSDAGASSHLYKVLLKYTDQEPLALCENLESLNLKVQSILSINRLTWNPYKGSNNGGYLIYGGKNSDDLKLLAEVSPDIIEYYLTATGSENIFYRIQVKAADCDSPFNAIKSNLVSTHPVGTVDENQEIPFKIYPNPSAGNFTISQITESTSVTIFNLLGNKVAETNGSTENIELKISEKGIYIVEVKNQAKVSRKYLIIQ